MADKRIRQFIIAVSMLMTGMSAGFILLALVYSGPSWIAFAVFLVYLFISYFVISFSIRYVKSLKK